ncbi:MAG: hypothetical protein ABI954_09950 [Pyrinomonadaceae bacterium]
MKLWKKIVLGLLILFVAVQIPFCWRRLQLGAINSKINDLNANRIEIKNEGFRHYKGVIHVHTLLGGHSAGSFNELIAAAQENGLDFVLLTEHPSPLYDTSRQTLNGSHGGVLFVGGNEVSSKQGDRFLILPGDADANQDNTKDTADLLNWAKQKNRLVLITYPDKYKAWETAKDFDGSEVYSLHSNAKNFPRFLTFFDYFWSFGVYPELTMARNFERPNANLQKFDELTSGGKKMILFGASDAHSNIGLSFSDRANHNLLKTQIDSYTTIFRLVRLHVWLENNKELTQENLLEAVKNGHCYLAFDVLGDSDGFIFKADTGAEQQIMGDDITLTTRVALSAQSPVKSRFILFRNGIKIQEFADTDNFSFVAHETGVYRVEVYLDSLNFSSSPWIISNPIYVKQLSIAVQ